MDWRSLTDEQLFVELDARTLKINGIPVFDHDEPGGLNDLIRNRRTAYADLVIDHALRK